jgi:hypothetical protein
LRVAIIVSRRNLKVFLEAIDFPKLDMGHQLFGLSLLVPRRIIFLRHFLRTLKLVFFRIYFLFVETIRQTDWDSNSSRKWLHDKFCLSLQLSRNSHQNKRNWQSVWPDCAKFRRLGAFFKIALICLCSRFSDFCLRIPQCGSVISLGKNSYLVRFHFGRFFRETSCRTADSFYWHWTSPNSQDKDCHLWNWTSDFTVFRPWHDTKFILSSCRTFFRLKMNHSSDTADDRSEATAHMLAVSFYFALTMTFFRYSYLFVCLPLR